MSRDTDRAESLRADLVRAIVDDTGVSETVAMPFANSVLAYLQANHAGGRMYVPKPTPARPVLHIEAALRAGRTVAWVCREYSVSPRTLHRMFPDGLPRAEARQA